jgi:hypothetical protein
MGMRIRWERPPSLAVTPSVRFMVSHGAHDGRARTLVDLLGKRWGGIPASKLRYQRLLESRSQPALP